MSSRERNAEVWFERIKEWQQSGLSAKSWCREHNVGYQSFLNWKRRHAESSPCVDLVPTGGFLRLDCAPVPLELEISGVRISVERGFDPVLLREVVAAVRGA